MQCIYYLTQCHKEKEDPRTGKTKRYEFRTFGLFTMGNDKVGHLGIVACIRLILPQQDPPTHADRRVLRLHEHPEQWQRVRVAGQDLRGAACVLIGCVGLEPAPVRPDGVQPERENVATTSTRRP